MMRNTFIIKKIICIIMCMSMLVPLFACNSKSSENQYTIYYTNSSKDKLVAHSCKLDAGMDKEEIAQKLLDTMNVRPSGKNEYVIKPENVNLLDITLKGKSINLNYTTAYKQMNTQTELLFRAAIVKALTQIDGIMYVQFYIDGKDATYEDGSLIGTLKSSDFAESDSAVGEMDWRNVALYYANSDGSKLVKVKEMLAYNKNMPVERMIVQRLISGPTGSDAYATLPKDVKLLGVSVVEKVCYVNLSEEFADELVNVASEVEIYSIVNSLCSLDYIDSVKIFINGDYSNSFKDNINLDRLYKFNESLLEDK